MSLIPTKICHGSADQPAHVVAKDQFTADKTRDDGLAVYCRSCAAARQRAWKHANQEKVRESKRRYRETHA